MAHWLHAFFAWWAATPPELRFLFALPFLVAAVGLLGDAWRQGQRGQDGFLRPFGRKPRPGL